MLKRLQILAAAVAASMALGGCAEAAGNQQESISESWMEVQGIPQAGTEASEHDGDHESVSAEDLFQARTLYIGNASGTGKLIQMIKSYYGIQEASTMELQTSMPPYGLMLHFKKEPDKLAMQKAAVLLIGLIDNCSSVSWDYPADLEDNRESYYISHIAAGQMLDEERYIKEYAESVDGVTRMLSLAEGITGHLEPKTRAASLDEAVSAAVLEYSGSVYCENEAAAEGHLILETEEKEDEVIVYALTMYGSYQFQDGNFVKDSGTGVIPAVITLNENADGSLWWKWYQNPQDGSGYQDSIEALFPESIWESCMKPDSKQRDALVQQEQSYAADYLKAIGRKAEIGEYRDFSHPLLTEKGVSVEVSNKLSDCGRSYPDSPAAYAPGWIGNIERLEDGIRYVYACAYDTEQQEVIYSKTEYDTGQMVEQIVFDAVSGEVKKADLEA